MNKKIIIAVAILTIVFNIFICFQLCDYIVEKQLLDKLSVSFAIYPNGKEMSSSYLIKKVKDFSLDNNVEIAQYSYLSSDEIDIYSTKKDIYVNSILFERIYNKDLIIHDFEDLFDVGFNGVLYFNTSDVSIIYKLKNELNDFCSVRYVESPYKEKLFMSSSSDNGFLIDIMPSLCIFIFCFAIIFFWGYSQCESDYRIYRLWGYSRIHIYEILSSTFFKMYILTGVSLGTICWGYIFSFSISGALLEFIIKFILIYLIILVLLLIVSASIFLMVLKGRNNRSKQLSLILLISYLIKVFLMVVLIVFIINLLKQTGDLENKRKNMSYWDNTENLYTINETYNSLNYDNLEVEKNYNEKIYNVYKELSDLDNNMCNA